MRGRKIKDCVQLSQHKPLELIKGKLTPFPNYICQFCERYKKCFSRYEKYW